MRRSSTLRMASPFAAATLLPHPRVESVAQAVAKEPEADGDRDKHRSREYEQVGIEPHLIGPVVDQGPERGRGEEELLLLELEHLAPNQTRRVRPADQSYGDGQREDPGA